MKYDVHGVPRALKGVSFLAVLTLSAFMYCIFLLAPALPLLLTPPPTRRRVMGLYRKWVARVVEEWLSLAVAYFELVGGVKVVVSGDELPRGERALIVSNHFCRTDWMFLWSLAMRTRQLSALRIVLKESLKRLVGFGWAMQMSLFVFLQRKRQEDLASMERLLGYLVRNRFPSSLLFFPEGTDLHEKALEKSKQYAEAKGLPVYKRVLHPKITGFLKILDCMTPALDAVYDVTVAYVTGEEGERPNEKTLMMQGRFPLEVHINVERIPIVNFPVSEVQRKAWLNESFARKEASLETFYSTTTSFKGAVDRSADFLLEARDACRKAVIFFGVVLGAASYAVTVSEIVRWYVLVTTGAFTILTGIGGLDVMELDLDSVLVHILGNGRSGSSRSSDGGGVEFVLDNSGASSFSVEKSQKKDA